VEASSLSNAVASDSNGWAGSVLRSVPSLEVAEAVWDGDGSAVVGLAAVSACCSGESLACGWWGAGLSDIEATVSFSDVADEAMVG
jgi:hypothetical protein